MSKIAMLEVLSSSKKGYNETFIIKKDGTIESLGYNISAFSAFKVIRVYDKDVVLAAHAACSSGKFKKTAQSLVEALQD